MTYINIISKILTKAITNSHYAINFSNSQISNIETNVLVFA